MTIHADGSIAIERHEFVRQARKEIRRLAKQALDVQNACNLSGILKSAYDAACSLRLCEKHGQGLSTDEVNQHYIMVLFAHKIADLTGVAGPWPKHAEADAVSYLQRFDTEGNRVTT